MGLESRRLDHLFATNGFQEKMKALVRELSINDICTVRNLTVQNHELKINKITDLKNTEWLTEEERGRVRNGM